MTEQPNVIEESTETPATPPTESAPPADTTEPAPTPIIPSTQPASPGEQSRTSPFFWGTGRRKTSVARVRIRMGEGKFVINDREMEAFFPVERDRVAVRKPLLVTESGKSFDVFVNVKGGGVTGQTGAVLLGLARALVAANRDHVPKLRENNLLTRDPREVERKKYGRSGARKRYQFSKR